VERCYKGTTRERAKIGKIERERERERSKKGAQFSSYL
jgi:hypothetical protein